MGLLPPSATYSDDLYHFHWRELGVEMLIENLQDRKEDISVELTVNFDHPVMGGRLFSGRLLLMGPNSRRDVRRSLSERVSGDEIDWDGMLEQVCLLARERFRRGEPLVELYSIEAQEQRQFLVEPFILDRAITILYGDGATAKSSLALRWALDISLNYGSVIYLDWEDDSETHGERLRALCAGIGIYDVGAGIYYQRRASRLSESVREVRRLIAEKGAKLVIVDSLGMAAGDPNNHDLMIEAVRACRSLGVAVLAIHHLPKNSLDKSKPFGSVYASNEARLTWLVEKTQEEESDSFEVLLTNHKTNRTRLFGKRALKVSYINGSEGKLERLLVEPTDAMQVDAFRSKVALWQHIAAVLGARGKMMVIDIKKALAEEGREVSEQNIRRALSERKRDFVNVAISSGKNAAVWALLNRTIQPHDAFEPHEPHDTARGNRTW